VETVVDSVGVGLNISGRVGRNILHHTVSADAAHIHPVTHLDNKEQREKKRSLLEFQNGSLSIKKDISEIVGIFYCHQERV
jgi:hypothetical protein